MSEAGADGVTERGSAMGCTAGLAIAVRRLNLMAMRTADEDCVLDITIGLEALLHDGNQEMTHKIALRAAALYKLTRNAKVRDVAVEHLRALLRVLLAKPEFLEPVQIDTNRGRSGDASSSGAGRSKGIAHFQVPPPLAARQVLRP